MARQGQTANQPRMTRQPENAAEIRRRGGYLQTDHQIMLKEDPWSEHLTTQTCSECGRMPSSRPRGIAGLGIREWTCDDCGTVHDRDVNAAKNILRCGLTALAEGALTSRLGSPGLQAGE